MTLALGIAATTTVFSFVDAALLRPLPYREPARLFVLWNERGDKQRETLSYPELRGLPRRWQRVRERRDLPAQAVQRGNARAARSGSRGRSRRRTSSERSVMPPAVGRDFAEGEDQKGGDAVVLVSDGYWRREARCEIRPRWDVR